MLPSGSLKDANELYELPCGSGPGTGPFPLREKWNTPLISTPRRTMSARAASMSDTMSHEPFMYASVMRVDVLESVLRCILPLRSHHATRTQEVASSCASPLS